MAGTDLEILRAKVNAFRVAEAKEVLQQLNLSKQGNKAELLDRILAIFQDAAALNSVGYCPRDINRQELAAIIIERVHKTQIEHGHVAWHARRHIAGLEAKAAALSRSAAPAGEGSNKRQRVDADSAAEQDGPAVNDVIKAFINGTDALSNTKVRCICSDHVDRGQMLQCEGAFCGVWQHAACVRQHLVGTPSPPGRTRCASREQFYCERCRVARADPFWEIFDAIVMPPAVVDKYIKQTTVSQGQGQPSLQLTMYGTGHRQFSLNKNNLVLLRAKPQEYRLVAMCLQLDDKVPFRVHWPSEANLAVEATNGSMIRKIRVSQRTSYTMKLGINQRDEGCDLRPLLPVSGGTNAAGMIQKGIQLEYTTLDHHSYLLVVYMMRRRSKEQVKALMKPPEQLAQAVQRVCRHMRGGHSTAQPNTPAAAAAAVAAAGKVDSNGIQTFDSDDDDVIIGNMVVSLRDPVSGQRMSVPARFTNSAGNAPLAFDLDTFLDMVAQSKKWLDPHNQEPGTVQNLQIDTYLAHILACLEHVPGVTEVEIDSEGMWRPAGSTSEFMSVLEQQKDMAAAAAQAEAAAATVVKAGSDGTAGPSAAGGDGDDEDDDLDPAEELRQAMAEFAAANLKAKQEKAALAAARAAEEGAEVIDLCSSDEDEAADAADSNAEPPAAAAAATAGSGTAATGSGVQIGAGAAPTAGVQSMQGIQQGLRIRLPFRPQQQQQQQQQPVQQLYVQQPVSGAGSGGNAGAVLGQAVVQPVSYQQQHAGGQMLQPVLQSGQQLQQNNAGLYVSSAHMQQHVSPIQLPLGSLAMLGSIPLASISLASGGQQLQHSAGQLPMASLPVSSIPINSMPMQLPSSMPYSGVSPGQQQQQLYIQPAQVQRPAGQPGSPVYVAPVWVQPQAQPFVQQLGPQHVGVVQSQHQQQGILPLRQVSSLVPTLRQNASVGLELGGTAAGSGRTIESTGPVTLDASP